MPGDDGEVECMLPKLAEACKPKCTAPYELYEKCKGRIAKKGEGDCEAWYFDYLKCIDKCRVPQMKQYLK